MTGERLRPIEGDAPDLAHLPTFCAFAPRCPYVEARCRSDIPGRDHLGDRSVRCFRAGVLELRGVGGSES